MITQQDLCDALRVAGVRAGDLLLVQSNLLRVGPVAVGADRGEVLAFYLDGFRRVLGESGTLVVLTSFEDYARFATPFVREQSPSRSGVFSEFVRTQPGAIRSVHPIVSLTALGPLAAEICDQPHFDGFGYDSAWARLHRANARLLTLGYGIVADGMTFVHYVERLYGVPYQYTKLYATPVYAAGREVTGPFTMSVRYLDFDIENDQRALKQELVNRGMATLVGLGRGEILCTDCDSLIDVAVSRLRQDRYFLLKTPPQFRAGTIPMDGNTGALAPMSQTPGD